MLLNNLPDVKMGTNKPERVIQMVKVIMGLKGSGKTKQLIELVRSAVEEDKGSVVVLEKEAKLTYDIPYQARLVVAEQYGVNGYDYLKGLISGLHAGNYDITQIFIDSLTKIVGEQMDRHVEDFLDWCESFSEREKVKFTVTISADINLATEGIKKYF